MSWKIPLFKMYWDNTDVEAVSNVIKRGTYWATGPEIEEFEKKIANFIGTKYALTFNSGTSALHTLLLAHGITKGEVIIPSFTFIATANAVILAGGTPIFAETEPETFGLNIVDVEKKINKNTQAIITIHYGGFPAKDSKKLRELADRYNILFIEDAAESLGASINNKKVGTFGHSAMFSFCQNKVLTTGEGGAIVTDNEKVYQKAKLIRSHGRIELADDYFASTEDNDYIREGYNFRMPTICAALGLSQLNKINEVINLRRTHARYLSKKLSEIDEIILPSELNGYYPVYQMYTIQVKKGLRDSLQKYLTKKGIMSKVYFNPVHLKTIYSKRYGYKSGNLPQTEELSKNVLNIPLYPGIKKEELDSIITTIKEFFAQIKEK